MEGLGLGLRRWLAALFPVGGTGERRWRAAAEGRGRGVRMAELAAWLEAVGAGEFAGSFAQRGYTTPQAVARSGLTEENLRAMVSSRVQRSCAAAVVCKRSSAAAGSTVQLTGCAFEWAGHVEDEDAQGGHERAQGRASDGDAAGGGGAAEHRASDAGAGARDACGRLLRASDWRGGRDGPRWQPLGRQLGSGRRSLRRFPSGVGFFFGELECAPSYSPASRASDLSRSGRH